MRLLTVCLLSVVEIRETLATFGLDAKEGQRSPCCLWSENRKSSMAISLLEVKPYVAPIRRVEAVDLPPELNRHSLCRRPR